MEQDSEFSGRDSYHHGDLHNAIVAAAERILVEEGVQQVTFRRIAREIGVSHNAPYRHFRNQTALFVVMSQRGYDRLRARLEQAAGDSPHDARGQLERFGWYYVAFALDNPNLYRLMFSREVLTTDDDAEHPELMQTFYHASDTLKAVFEQGQRDHHLKAQDADTQALTFWSLLHGLALLWIDRQIAPFFMSAETSAEAAVRACVRVLLDGMGRGG